MKDLSHPLRVYVGIVSLLGGGLLLLALSRLPTYDLGGYAFFVLLSILIEAATIRWQSPKGRVVSASSALTYAVLIVYGPLPAGLVNAVKGLVSALYPERRSWHRAIFDAALLAISDHRGGCAGPSVESDAGGLRSLPLDSAGPEDPVLPWASEDLDFLFFRDIFMRLSSSL